jgi:spermidine synthase
MIPWKLLEEAPVPFGKDPLRLYQRGKEFSIRVGPYELMNSRVYGTEDSLAQLACAPLATQRNACVLIGGLGVGYTLAAALRVLGPTAKVVQAELVPAVVRWNRGEMGEVAGHPLRDPRVQVVERDVLEIMREQRARYHAIMLDVDNGPEGLTRDANEALYLPAGLAVAKAALCPGGAVWYWSSGPRPTFVTRLKKAGFNVKEHNVRSGLGSRSKGARHVLWEALPQS